MYKDVLCTSLSLVDASWERSCSTQNQLKSLRTCWALQSEVKDKCRSFVNDLIASHLRACEK